MFFTVVVVVKGWPAIGELRCLSARKHVPVSHYPLTAVSGQVSRSPVTPEGPVRCAHYQHTFSHPPSHTICLSSACFLYLSLI